MSAAPIGFRITGGKGFHITFENGWTVSVQFGPGNYCDNYGEDWDKPEKAAAKGSSTAEVAAWPPEGHLVQLPNHDDVVSNRSTPAEVLAILNWAAEQGSVVPEEQTT